MYKKVVATVLFFVSIIASPCIVAQNLNFDEELFRFYRYALKPLDPAAKTYSVKLHELNAQLYSRQKDSLLNALQLKGYRKIVDQGDVQLELIVSPFVVTSKEAKDKPIETERDGKKHTQHQYSYELHCSFPMRLRMLCMGKLIVDQDLAGFFPAVFYPRDNSSLANLQHEYDADRDFLNGVRQKRIDELSVEIRKFIDNQFAHGLHNHYINVGYVKDKKGMYEDVSMIYKNIRQALADAQNAEQITPGAKAKIGEAIIAIQEVLEESSDDKNARIDKKVSSMLKYNLAICYYALQEFDKAEAILPTLRKAQGYTSSAAGSLERLTADRKARHQANGLLPGERYVAPEVTSSLVAVTQPALPAKVYRDYLVSLKGDTVDVQFVLPSADAMPMGDTLWLQDQIFAYKNDKRVELVPGEIHGFSYQGIYRESLSWTKDMTTRPWTFEKKFCKRVVQGDIPLFTCYEVKPSTTDPRRQIVSTKLMYRKDDNLTEVMFLNFNKGASKVVEGYPELATRVRNGEFKREEFARVLEEYNSWKKSQHK